MPLILSWDAFTPRWFFATSPKSHPSPYLWWCNVLIVECLEVYTDTMKIDSLKLKNTGPYKYIFEPSTPCSSIVRLWRADFALICVQRARLFSSAHYSTLNFEKGIFNCPQAFRAISQPQCHMSQKASSIWITQYHTLFFLPNFKNNMNRCIGLAFWYRIPYTNCSILLNNKKWYSPYWLTC